MAERTAIDLVELFIGLRADSESVVFEDADFRRQRRHLKLDSAIDADIITDWRDSEGVGCCHVSMYFVRDESVDFVFDRAEEISSTQGRLVTYGEGEGLFWMPKEPMLRLYDGNGRIESATESAFEVKSRPGGFQLSVAGKTGRRVEFSSVIFTKNIESFTNQIRHYRPIELRRVTRSDWFCYEGLKDIWDHFINGTFFNIRHRVHKRAWQGQNTAYVLYYHLAFLHNQTKKEIYRLLCDFIAYSVMLSLPDDSQWRHGIWTDIMETHTVHQVAGIHLLLSYYKRRGRDIFLQKAKLATDYLIWISDELSGDEIWFLHDTLETNMADSKLFYNIFRSEAFGKSVPNTLCLNSHIWTLTALYRLKQLDSDQRYGQYFEKGLNALKHVLQASPCDMLFCGVYRPREFLVGLCTKSKSKVTRKIHKVYTLTLMRYLLPFLKKTFPRLVMPNGFIERDLSHTALSDFYHFLNIEAILMLYNQTKADWLGEIVKKSVKYSVDSGLAKHVFARDPKAMVFLDVLLLYCGLVDEQYLPLLPEYIAHFQELNSSVPVNILSNPLIAAAGSPLRVDNEDVLVLAPAGGKNISAIVINATDKDRKVTIKSDSEDETDELEIIDPENRRFSLGQEVVVPKMNLVKIVRKHG
jgi:hypothetical protein